MCGGRQCQRGEEHSGISSTRSVQRVVTGMVTVKVGRTVTKHVVALLYKDASRPKSRRWHRAYDTPVPLMAPVITSGGRFRASADRSCEVVSRNYVEAVQATASISTFAPGMASLEISTSVLAGRASPKNS